MDRIRSTAILLVFLLISSVACADVPQFLSFQARITKDGQNVNNPSATIKFDIYDDADPPLYLNSGQIDNIEVVDGMCVIKIPVDSGAQQYLYDKAYQIKLTYNDGVTDYVLDDIQPLASAPYAITARSLVGINNTSIVQPAIEGTVVFDNGLGKFVKWTGMLTGWQPIGSESPWTEAYGHIFRETGNVIIGPQTLSTAYKLVLSGQTSDANPEIALGIINADSGLKLAINGPGKYQHIDTYDIDGLYANTLAFKGGNVGINDNVPESKLSIKDSSSTAYLSDWGSWSPGYKTLTLFNTANNTTNNKFTSILMRVGSTKLATGMISLIDPSGTDDYESEMAFQLRGGSPANLREVLRLSSDKVKITNGKLVLEPKASTPAAEQGAVYYDSNKKRPFYYNGTNWLPLGGVVAAKRVYCAAWEQTDASSTGLTANYSSAYTIFTTPTDSDILIIGVGAQLNDWMSGGRVRIGTTNNGSSTTSDFGLACLPGEGRIWFQPITIPILADAGTAVTVKLEQDGNLLSGSTSAGGLYMDNFYVQYVKVSELQ